MREAWRPARRALALACCILLFTVAASAADLPHLDLDVNLDPAARRLQAVAVFDASHDLGITLHRSLSVAAASVNGVATPFTVTQVTAHARQWHVAVPKAGRVRIVSGGVLPALDPGVDHRSVLGVATPMASPAGSFLPAASHWYPHPASAYSYEVRLTLPSGQRGIVPGDLHRESQAATASPYRATFRYAPPADGIDLMAGPYVVDEKLVPRAANAPLRLRTYFTPALRSLAPAYLDDAARYIALYSDVIGSYPYESFSIVASPLPTGLGMPTLTYIGAEVLKLPFIRATALGHEALHNWWGNGVFVDYARGNWSEGLTTFMGDYAYKESESADAAREMRLAWLRDLAAMPPGAAIPLVQFRARTHGAEAAVGYGKSAMVFFILRDLIGTAAFERGIRLFWTQQRFKTASWDDLRHAFEQAAGRPLEAFFEQWLRRADAPRIAIDAAVAKSVNGRTVLELALRQSDPPYMLRVPVAVMSGARSQIREVVLDEIRTRATLPLDGRPDTVRLDPDLRLYRRLDDAELSPILRQWIVARAPRYAVISQGARIQEAADALAQRFFETPARRVPAEFAGTRKDPLLVVGLHADLEQFLERRHLPQRPAVLPAGGSAYVWTLADSASPTPLAFVSVRDATALSALLRPLPHYGGQSYLVFDGSRMVARGVWPAAAHAVPVTWR